MFAVLGRLAARRPWYVIAAWVILAVVIISLAPKLTSTTDESEFLPNHYESIKAAQIQQKEFPAASQPGAILVFDHADGSPLTAADSAKAKQVVDGLNAKLTGKISRTFRPSTTPPVVAKDKSAAIAIIGLAKDASGFDTNAIKDAKTLRADAKPLIKGTGLKLQMTGPAPQSLDSQDSSAKTMEIVAAATILLIVLLLALIFRSVIICLLPIVVVAVASQVATGLIAMANKAFDLKADSSIQVILIVVLYGIGTDYILFLLFRYRERLRMGEEPKVAIVHAMERAGEAIASAGGAVIVAFMALVLSSLSIFRSIGPALAIAVAVTLVAALTLVPALMTLLGKALFWPSKSWHKEPTGARFATIGKSLGAHPVRFAVASGGVLAILAVFALSFNPTFDFTSGLPSNLESTQATKTLQKSFAAGTSDPATVLLQSRSGPLDQGSLASFQTKLDTARGVDQVSPAQLSKDGTTAAFSVTLNHDPGSDQALSDIKGPIRSTAHDAAPPGTTAYVGGNTSVFADLQKAMARDYSIVFPVAAIIIMLILALLLRSLVAPLYLMASVGLGFGATLGASVILFQHIKGDSGLIFMLPIYIYLFVVALGTDYNILMIARLREEARAGKNAREAAAEAVKHAGPTIAAAGLILAGTFASLMLGGQSLIVSMGFALSFGIFVAAFVMSMFFTPSLTALIGHAAWWPGHGDESAEEHDQRVRQEPDPVGAD